MRIGMMLETNGDTKPIAPVRPSELIKPAAPSVAPSKSAAELLRQNNKPPKS